MPRPAIFLDRDGVLNVNRSDYVKSWAEFDFLPNTFQALRQLSRLGCPLVVVTNQAGIGRQIIPRETVDEIHRRMRHEARRRGARIDGIYYCPHKATEDCRCRKPEPGLLFQAADQFDIDLDRSVLIGDADTDIAAGQRAGCRTILVMTGRGAESQARYQQGSSLVDAPDAVTSDLLAAVPIVTEFMRPTARLQPLRQVGSFDTLPQTTRLPVAAIEHEFADVAGHFTDD